MFEVRPLDYARAIGGGLGAGVGGAVVLSLLLSMAPRIGFLGLLLMAGFGYLVGEAVAWCTNHKRGNILGIIAALAVPAGMVVVQASLFMLGGASPVIALTAATVSLAFPLWSLFGLLLAMGVAFSRVH